MPTTTTSPKDWRLTFSDQPDVVHSVPDICFLSDDGKVTIAEIKSEGTTTGSERPPARVPRVLAVEESQRLGFILLQKWEGVVLQTDADTFSAQLIDSHAKLPPHNATFARSEMPADEQSLIENGAPFVWTLGYRQIGRTRERASVLYFRRLPTWTEKEITEAEQNGQTLSNTVGWK